MWSSPAIVPLSLPFAISFSTSISRSESSVRIVSAMSGCELVARCLDAADPRHVEVHHDHVGRQLPHETHRLSAVAGLPDDVDSLLFEQVPETRAKKIVIVDEQNANSRLTRPLACLERVAQR